MLTRTALVCVIIVQIGHAITGVSVLHQSAVAEDDKANSGPSLRSRRSPPTWSYRPRATRTFSEDELDAFNQGLHRKRPKFIGKRHSGNEYEDLVAAVTGCRPPNCPAPSVDGHGPLTDSSPWSSGPTSTRLTSSTGKRSPPRKFVGKKSTPFADNSDGGGGSDYSSDVEWAMSAVRRTSPPRKFVGKRPSRKFVGRRAEYTGDAVDVDDEQRHSGRTAAAAALLSGQQDKRASRKFVG